MSATRKFSGSSLEEILPRIRAELGPDAVITRQREGLSGGVAGFFARRFVEVEASSGGGGFDVVDDSDALPDLLASESTVHSPQSTDIAEGMTSLAIQRVMQQAAPFAAHLQAESLALDKSSTTVLRSASAAALERRLSDGGVHPALAEGIVTEAVAHLLPFAGSSAELERLVVDTLARRIPVNSSWTRPGRTIAFVGPGGSGKTLCTARLAAAYALGGELPVICMSVRPRDGGAELSGLLAGTGVNVEPVDDPAAARARIAGERDRSVIVIDTPSASGAHSDSLGQLASDLDGIGVYEVHLTLPATMGQRAGADVLRGLDPLGVSRIALTHAHETGHVGPAVGLAIGSGKPFSYISSGSSVPGGLVPANATALATAVLS